MNTSAGVLHLIGAGLLLLSQLLRVDVVRGDEVEKLASNYRLPEYIRPTRYELTIRPYFDASDGKKPFTFDAMVIITLSTEKPHLSEIVLHQKGLLIESVKLKEQITRATVPITAVPFVFDTDHLGVKLSRPLEPNVDYAMRIIYNGTIGSDMVGFYRSSYTENGVTKWMAATHMQPTFARRVLPCFDEPAFKAVFAVSIDRPAHFPPSVSNGQLASSSVPLDATKLVRDTFEPTPPMSTYLLAFVVSEYRLRENNAGTFAVLARPLAYSQTDYIYNVGQQTLDAMSAWLAYDYYAMPNISKMYLVALPDSNVAAMENWALLTFREATLLHEAGETSAWAQQRLVTMVVHEQAHMWFGNLVTVDWWSETWLNEGFAQFFQYFGTALVMADWQLEEQFVVQQMHVAMALDAQLHAKALRSDVTTPGEIAAKFDRISYNKGAAILRMLQHAMGTDAFQSAVRDYLVQRALRTTSEAYLLNALNRQMGASSLVDIRAFVKSWTKEPGYPVLRVRHLKHVVTFEQERFWLGHRAGDSAPPTEWAIPISSASSDNPDFQRTRQHFVMTGKREVRALTDTADIWRIYNVQQTGYYRVNYDDAEWWKILAALKAANHSGIHVQNRAQIVDDLLNLARAEYVNYTIALSGLEYLKRESAYIPWLAAFNNLAYVTSRLKGDDFEQYKTFMLNISDYAFETLTFNASANDTRTDIYARDLVLSHRCRYDDQKCLDAALPEFERMRANDEYKVQVNIRSVVYCTAIAHGNQSVWDLFWERYRTANVASEQELIMRALGCTRNNATLHGYLDKIVGADVRLHDKMPAFAATHTGQPQNVQSVLDYVTAYHMAIATLFNSEEAVAELLAGVAQAFTDQEQIDQLDRFRRQTRDYGELETLKQALADAQFNLVWAAEHVPQIVAHLRAYNGGAAVMTSAALVALGVLLGFLH